MNGKSGGKEAGPGDRKPEATPGGSVSIHHTAHTASPWDLRTGPDAPCPGTSSVQCPQGGGAVIVNDQCDTEAARKNETIGSESMWVPQPRLVCSLEKQVVPNSEWSAVRLCPGLESSLSCTALLETHMEHEFVRSRETNIHLQRAGSHQPYRQPLESSHVREHYSKQCQRTWK